MYNEYVNINLKKRQTIDIHGSNGDTNVNILVIIFKN